MKQFRFVHIIWLVMILFTCSHAEDPAKDKTLVRIGEFPAVMEENSGMTEYKSLLWNINDSGNEPAVFGYNKQTNMLDKKVIIGGAVNTDWEEITQDDQHLYIGDFGNNAGDRHDLRIYIIDKSALQTSSDTIPYSGLISFTYPDQTDFTSSPMNTPFDCEAFIALDDSLILFTKDWQSEQTGLYSLPAIAGNYEARFIKRYDISGLVTAAAYSTAKKELLLLGYRDYIPFIRIVQGFEAGKFSLVNGERIDFVNFLGAQTEGIAYSGDGSVYVSCEKSPLVVQTLYRAEIR
jgi:hypothetical protein